MKPDIKSSVEDFYKFGEKMYVYIGTYILIRQLKFTI